MNQAALLETGPLQFPSPRPFQATAHEALRQGIKNGHKNQMLMSPTGSGKTFLGLRIASEALQKGKKAIFVCDRTTLINQTSETADRYGLVDHGVLQANHWRFRRDAPLQIASAQTLARRDWPDADVIIVDEAHTQLKAWTEYIPTCSAKVVGLSATPFSKGLGKLFTNLVNAATMHDLTQQGILVPMRVFTGVTPDMRGAKVVAGEWSEDEVEARGNAIIGDIVTEWHSRSRDRKTIVFGATIAHCHEIATQFSSAGIMSAVFSSKTPNSERNALLTEFRKSDSLLRVLVSVEALAKGFDVPDVGCVVDCRPLRKSLSTAIQMWGRGLRSYPDKQDCVVHDHSGNMVRFAKDFEHIYFHGLDSLDAGEKLDATAREEKEERVEADKCPSCGATPFVSRCMSCGHEKKNLSLVASEVGELQEFTLKKTSSQVHDIQVWKEISTYARSKKSDPEMARKMALAVYRSLMKAWPPQTFFYDHRGENVPISMKVYGQIMHDNIAYRKSKRNAAGE